MGFGASFGPWSTADLQAWRGLVQVRVASYVYVVRQSVVLYTHPRQRCLHKTVTEDACGAASDKVISGGDVTCLEGEGQKQGSQHTVGYSH